MLNNQLFVSHLFDYICLITEIIDTKKEQVVTEAKNKIIQKRQAFILNQSAFVY